MVIEPAILRARPGNGLGLDEAVDAVRPLLAVASRRTGRDPRPARSRGMTVETQLAETQLMEIE